MNYGMLAQALRSNGDVKEAKNVITQGYKKLSEGEEPTSLKANETALLWSNGEFDKALELQVGGADDDSLFYLSISRLFTRNTPNDRELKTDDIDAFLKSSHNYTDYVRLLYYWNLMREGNIDEAQKLLVGRWNEIDPKSWQVRRTPERGDYMAVWREMLIGYYLRKVPKEDISELMENLNNFEASDFNNSEQSRQGFLCEWYFYDALFQSVNGDPSTRRSRLLANLEKAVSTNQRGFHEYSLANNLIKRIGEGEDLTFQSHEVGAE